MSTLTAALRRQFDTYGDIRTFTFLREVGRKLVEDVTTFGDLDRDARGIAAWLSARPDADRPVLLLFEPGIDFWRAFIGCVYAGVTAIPAPLPHDQRSMSRLTGILRDADTGVVLTAAYLEDTLTAGIDALQVDRAITVVAVDEGRLGDPDAWTAPQVDATTVAFLQYTSGSTGDPKGVSVMHGNVLHNYAAITAGLGLDDSSVLIGWVPHFHDLGLISQLVCFLGGMNVVVMSPLAFLKQPVRLLTAISDHRGTVSGGPNFSYDLIVRRLTPEQLAELDLSSWETAFSGAEPVRRRTVERLAETLAPAGFASSAPRASFGMAESTLAATISAGPGPFLEADAEALERNRYVPATGRAVSLVSCGAPALGMTVRIVDPETLRRCSADEVGEIWLSGGSVAAGYHDRPADNAERFTAHTSDGEGPYLRTGDLGFLHDGELYVTGRRKDLIIVNGRNLYPQDIEDAAQTVHPAIAGARGGARARDLDDTPPGGRIHAKRPPPPGDTSLAELAAELKKTVARAFEMPAPSVVFVARAGIHLTTSGKVQRASMRTALLNGELTDVIGEAVDPTLSRPGLATTERA